MKNRDPDSFFVWFFILCVLYLFQDPTSVVVPGISLCICLTPSMFQCRPTQIILTRGWPRRCRVFIGGCVRGARDNLSHCDKLASLVKVGLLWVSLHSAPQQSLTPYFILHWWFSLLRKKKKDFWFLSFLLHLLVGILLYRPASLFSPLLPIPFKVKFWDQSGLVDDFVI